MLDISSPTLLAGLVTLIVGLFLYSFLVPRNQDNFEPLQTPQGNRSVILLSKFGTELYATLPKGVGSNRSVNPRTEALLVSSGNPWRMTAQEFTFFQWVTAVVGCFLGGIAWFAVSKYISLPLPIFIAGGAILGFITPRSKYRDQAKKRDLEFKRQLPEALDLIIISLSGGLTFSQALRDSLPNMKDGVLKEEFREIVRQIDTGRTVNDALRYFGERAPNESIKTFVQAVREANELNIPLEEVLSSRAQASREEFFAMIHAKTASLSPKMMGILAPTLIPALMLLLLAPAISSIYSTFGG